MKVTFLVLTFSILVVGEQAAAMGIPKIPRAIANENSVVAVNSEAAGGVANGQTHNHRPTAGSLKVYAANGAARVTIFENSRAYHYVVPASDDFFITNSGYSGQAAKISLSCPRRPFYSYGDHWVKSGCRVMRISFSK